MLYVPFEHTFLRRVLLVEDNAGDAALVRNILNKIWPGISLVHAVRLTQAIEQVGKTDFDLIILDLSLPDSQGVEGLVKLIEAAPEKAVVVLTGNDDRSLAIASLRHGAQDYLVKDMMEENLLIHSLGHAMERHYLHSKLREAQRLQEETLRSVNQELEKKVAARTHELKILNESLKEEVTEHLRLEEKILTISESERRRIGQELHDGICQHLTSLMYLVNVLEGKLRKKSPSEAADAQEIGDIVKKANIETRGFAHGLYPPILEASDLVNALEELAHNAEKSFKGVCQFTHDARIPDGTNGHTIHLYRIAQEAVHNAVKHSGATSISINLKGKEDGFTLKISDNGNGFFEKNPKKKGVGLEIMRYRARMIGGSLDIHSDGKHGACVTLQVRGKYSQNMK